MSATPVASPSLPPANHRLLTLGSTGLYETTTGTQLLGAGKPLALLTYLALAPGRRASREFLIDLLWADLDPDRGRAALRQILFHLRRLLGEDALPGTEELTLRHGLVTDRDEFLGALERGDVEEAVQRYGGAFLPDFGVPGGVAFEHWADLERARLQAAYLRAVELVVRRLLNQSRFREAQRLARQARDESPASEATWRLLLEAIVAGQDFVAASVEAEALERWAAEDGITLEPTTAAVVARARRVAPEGSSPAERPGLATDLIGREREFAAITSAWDEVRRGSARYVHLSAPAGLGKTRLLRDAAARLRASGAPVIEVRASPGERDISYALAGVLAAALIEAPGALGVSPASATSLVALNPVLSSRLSVAADASVGDEALRRRMQAVLDLLQAVADAQPVALVLDDLHWGDAASVRLIEGVTSRLDRAPVLVLSAARPEYIPGTEHSLRLLLPPLTRQAIAEMVRGVALVSEGAEWLDALVSGLERATQGSPLLVLETLRLALDQDVLGITSGTWSCRDPQQLADLLGAGQALRHRIDALPEHEHVLLGLLATLGTPADLGLLDDAYDPRRSPGDVAGTLAALERAGLVVRHGSAWQVAHDEIADAIRRDLAPEAARRLHAEVGRRLIAKRRADRAALLRCVRHLAQAGEMDAVRAAFRRYVRAAWDEGDRRKPGPLAEEALGAGPNAAGARALAASLPVSWRIGLWSRTRQAVAAAALFVAVGGAAGAAQVREARLAEMQRLVYSDSLGETVAVIARRAEWDGRTEEVRPERMRSALAGVAADFPDIAPAISPDGRAVAWNRYFADSTVIDIWIRTPAGARRLTGEPRDDLVVSWLPDGSGLVGMSHRWSGASGEGYDIAVFDTATGAARQVTRGPAHDRLAFASPDGSRIAFLREPVSGPWLLCMTAFDGMDEPECRLPGGNPLRDLHGWLDSDHLLASVVRNGTQVLARYAWSSGTLSELLGRGVTQVRLSPDRRWAVAASRVPGVTGTTDWVVPLSQPSEARRVGGIPRTGETPRWWEGRADPPVFIDRLEFMDSLPRLQPGVGSQLTVRALAGNGIELPLAVRPRWRSSDTTVAAVDSLGVVHPRRIGEVEISASIGGWRTATRRLRIEGTAPQVVFREDWDATWTDRWIRFGTPTPEVAIGPGGIRGFWNGGDGIHISTAVLRQPISARDGLGVELLMHTPVTDASHQRARIQMAAGTDTLLLQRADPQGPPPRLGASDAHCIAAFPAGVGGRGAGYDLDVSAGGVAGTSLSLGVEADTLAAGGWWRLRIQILPDGRCGVAVNGRVVWLSPDPIPLDRPLWLRLGDNSAGTQLLHGPLGVWTGVRADIDWATPAGVRAP